MNVRITMAHVASRAGVHPTTVSLALRNHPSIPPVTRERLRKLADEMGYRPDPALNALTAYRHATMPRRETPPLAYLTRWDTEWGWKQARAHARFYEGALGKAYELGYRLEHFWLGEPGMSPQRMSDILFARGIAGVLVASHLFENDRPLALDWAKFSAVKIDCLPREPVLNHVTNDHRGIVQLAMNRIMAAGHRRIGMVMPRLWDEFSNLAWSAGFLAEQQRLAPKDRIPILHFPGMLGGEVEAPGRVKVLADWIERHRPEVLLSKAQLVYPYLEALGLVVPRDLAFVEIYLDPDGQTAGVRQNCERVGALAVETLVNQLQQHTVGIPEFPVATLIGGTWFDGATLPVRTPLPAPAQSPRATPKPRAEGVDAAVR